MANVTDEYWDALRMYQAVQEVCIPFACSVAGGVWFRFGPVMALPAGLVVYFVFMFKATSRKRDAVRAYQAAKLAAQPEGSS